MALSLDPAGNLPVELRLIGFNSQGDVGALLVHEVFSEGVDPEHRDQHQR